jgi:hypothetical protein
MITFPERAYRVLPGSLLIISSVEKIAWNGPFRVLSSHARGRIYVRVGSHGRENLARIVLNVRLSPPLARREAARALHRGYFRSARKHVRRKPSEDHRAGRLVEVTSKLRVLPTISDSARERRLNQGGARACAWRPQRALVPTSRTDRLDVASATSRMRFPASSARLCGARAGSRIWSHATIDAPLERGDVAASSACASRS